MNFTVLRFDSIDSTNLEALKQARLGADEGSCIIARRQTAGRGRHGREWSSPSDAGLYLSVVLRPKLEVRFLPLITLSAAIAVYDALIELGVTPDIKWPNDILVNDKKICGILAETSDTAQGLVVVAGIGLNLTSDSFTSEIIETATCLAAELGRTAASTEVENVLLKYFGYWYDRLQQSDGPRETIDEWAKRSSYFTGKPVKVTLSNEQFVGITDGLEENGALRIRRDDDGPVTVQAGDIERLRPDIV
jgi:BirA family biotin operon repressor/biotin-[acetyl-CoA-carboxylase] ligase